MHGIGNRIYGHHMIIHNGQFAECEVLGKFSRTLIVVQVQGLEVQEQGLVNLSSRTRTFFED